MSKVTNGDTVRVHYQGTFTDGEEFDNSFTRGEPLSFTLGEGQMIPGFEKNVLGMAVGETKEITLTPEDGYGPRNPTAIQDLQKEVFPTDFEFTIGGVVTGNAPTGQPMMATILSEQEETVTLDFNHPLAGKNLNFKIELVELNASQETE